ncbi:hypothetical protein [Sorangium sp. So ce131]|uniref:hypothetical protein n=1 Tax=Sorangium sp. So ce131 TaxID=3133282 RepID=UPI003F6195CA
MNKRTEIKDITAESKLNDKQHTEELGDEELALVAGGRPLLDVCTAPNTCTPCGEDDR